MKKGNLALTLKVGESAWAGPVRIKVVQMFPAKGQVRLCFEAPGVEIMREEIFIAGRDRSEAEAIADFDMIIPRERVTEAIREGWVAPTK